MLGPELTRPLIPVFLYHPGTGRVPPAEPLPAELPGGRAVRIEAEDGVGLHAWWVPARDEAAGATGPDREAGGRRRACGVAIFFHGNAGSLASRAPIARMLTDRGLDVLLPDYRGFGRSEGEPWEEGLYRDGRAAYRYVREERGRPASKIVLLGHSLGGAVATRVASERPVAGLVVTAAFTSLPAIARDLYPWVPGRFFDWEPVPFPTAERIAAVDAPVLVGRGGADRLIPREHVRALYRAAGASATWVEARRAAHDDLWWDEEFRAALGAFLDRVTGCGGAEGGRQPAP